MDNKWPNKQDWRTNISRDTIFQFSVKGALHKTESPLTVAVQLQTKTNLLVSHTSPFLWHSSLGSRKSEWPLKTQWILCWVRSICHTTQQLGNNMDASRKAILEHRQLQNELALHLKDHEDDDRKWRRYVNVSACLIVENIKNHSFYLQSMLWAAILNREVRMLRLTELTSWGVPCVTSGFGSRKTTWNTTNEDKWNALLAWLCPTSTRS